MTTYLVAMNTNMKLWSMLHQVGLHAPYFIFFVPKWASPTYMIIQYLPTEKEKKRKNLQV